MSNIKVDYDILNQKQTPAFYASSLATRPAFGFPGRIFIDTDTPSSGIYRDTGSVWVQVADPGAGTTGTLQQVTTNGNTTTLGVIIQGININDGAGTGANNVAIGNNALSVNTTGSANTALGYVSLNVNTTGIQNTGVGYNSLFANTTGNQNTAIGTSALSSNISGSNNTGIGQGALQSNTTGSNTAVGSAALSNNTTGTSNTAIGISALSFNTTASGNTAVGSSSLFANTTGASNTAVGFSSLLANTTGANNTAIGGSALITNTTGSSNTALGVGTLYFNTTGNNNVGIGNQALQQNTTGANNTAVGSSSLIANTTGQFNTAVGFGTLAQNTTSNYNTALGYTALSNTTGANNTAIGGASLVANTTGANNVALGYSALVNNTTANNNTAVGSSALSGNTTGLQNSAYGGGSLSGITTGSNNTAIGYASGGAITTGSNNTIIGEYVGTTTLTSNIVLADGLGNVRLFSDANGLIGINQAVGSVPGGQLDIHTTQTYALVLNGLTTSNAYTAFSNNSVGKWRIGNTYNAGANTFDIYNLGTSSNALSFNSTTNAATLIAALNGTTATFSGAVTFGSGTYSANIAKLYTDNLYGAIITGKTGTACDLLLTDRAGNLAYQIVNNGTTPNSIFGGNVGIGTISPNTNSSLTLNQTSNFTFLSLYNASTNANSRNWCIGINNDVFGDFAIKTSNALNGDPTTGTSRIYIANTGNVLIGSTTDDTTNKLQVSGTTKSTGYKSSSGNTGNAVNATNYGIINVTSRGVYYIYAQLPAGIGNSVLYTSFIQVLADGSSARIINSNNGTSVILSLSGTLVSVLQSSGGDQGAGIDWSFILQPY
jgi:hypothetical protein